MYSTYQKRTEKNRTLIEKLADTITKISGSIGFLIGNILVFVLWVLVNMGVFGNQYIFDPAPYGLLTMAVSLEAIILSIFVLISQNREQTVNDIRDEITIQISRVAEAEITKVIELLLYNMKHNGVNVDDNDEIKKMLAPLDSEEIERSVENDILPSKQRLYDRLNIPLRKD